MSTDRQRQRAPRRASPRPARASGSTRSSASLIETGELRRLVEEDSLRGVTSNPAIFEKAILGSHDYDEQIERARPSGADARAIYQRDRDPATSRRPATSCAPVYDETDALRRLRLARGRPRPRVRHRQTIDAGARVLGARRPPEPDDQDPGHRRGPPGDRADASTRGININVTLLFSVEHVRAASSRRSSAALERRHDGGQVARRPLGRVVLRLARRHRGRQAPGGARRARDLHGPRRPGQRPRRLPALPGDLPRRALRRAARGRRARAAPAVGVDRRQEPALPRHDVRRRARRRPTPSTRCRWRRCRPPPTTARSPARRPTRTRREDLRGARRRRASTSTTSPTSCCATASTRSSRRWRSCWRASSPSARRSSPRGPPTIDVARCPTSSSRPIAQRVAARRGRGRRPAHLAARTTRCGARPGSRRSPTASAG